MKINLPVKKPRNPLVVPAVKRKAGKHRNRKKDQQSKPIEE